MQLRMFAPTAGALSFHACSTWDEGFVQALREHYTGSLGAPPGRKLAWFVVESDAVVGVLGLGEPPYKLAPRPAGSSHGARVWGDAEPKLVFYRGPLCRVSP